MHRSVPGMNQDARKRPPPTKDTTISPQSSSSAFSRSAQSYSLTNIPTGERTPSPPASSYFPSVSLDQDREPEPTADADQHFAYSTTLRRHHGDRRLSETFGSGSFGQLGQAIQNEGAAGVWNRVVRFVTGRREETSERLEDGYSNGNGYISTPKQQTATPSSLFTKETVEATLQYFRTPVATGLSSSSISALLQTHGYNEFSVPPAPPLILKFAQTIYESPLILLLCGSAGVSALMGNVDDAVSIAVAVLIVLTVGFVQERRSEKSLEALNKLVPHHCHVFRDTQTHHILANELVPGDLIHLSTGDRVPADIRLIDCVELEIDESSLTGEGEPRRKNIERCRGDGVGGEVPLAERTCIAYMGTLVRNGRGMGIVIATGTQTEFGVIFSMMQDVEEKRTPLQLSMDELAKKLSMISFGVIGIICLIGVSQQRSWLEMFTIGVSLAVAAIPEGLPIVTTVTLALGVLRMAKRKAIVKKLHSVEALGSVSVICSDKTGTLTKNEQTVVLAYSVDETISLDPLPPPPERITPALRRTFEIGCLCNNANAKRNEAGAWVGQSTDVASLNVLDLVGMGDARVSFTRLSERPFNSEQKFMAVSGVHATSQPSVSPLSVANARSKSPVRQREMYYIKGSIDAVLSRCMFYYVSDDSIPSLDAGLRNVILSTAQGTAAKGLRVIAMAYGFGSVETASPYAQASSAPGTRANSPQRERSELVFVGFQAMLDPPRKGVADAISLLQSGGVQIVMITGDAEETALSIAQQLGLRVGASRHRSGITSERLSNGERSYVLTGKEIDGMSKLQLRERVGTVSVFARTTPRHKMAIVEAFQSRGAVVAMTGDGVNDAPALKMADIGISMGKSGTDVAKEAADMILVDDNFTTILPAVEEGKSIFHNIQNFLSFQLSTAAAALTLITLSTFFGLSNPLNAMQILFINILMDGPPSQSLGVDPVDPAVMRKAPRRKDEPIITRRLLYRVLFSASIIVTGTLFVYMFALSDDHMSRREQTMTFTCFVFLDLVSALQNRGLACGLTQNRMLITTVSISFVTQLALIYVPIMQAIFQTQALGMWDLFMLLGLGACSMTLHEGRRRWEKRDQAGGAWSSVVEEMA